MAVDIFGHTNTNTAKTSGRTGSGGGGAFLRLDGTNKVTADIDLNLQKIINLGQPTDSQDAATMQYVKDMCRSDVYVAVLGNMRGQSIDPLPMTTRSGLRYSRIHSSGQIQLLDRNEGIYELSIFAMHNEEDGKSTQPFVIMLNAPDQTYEKRIDALGQNVQSEYSMIIEHLRSENSNTVITVNARNDDSRDKNINVKLYIVVKRLV